MKWLGRWMFNRATALACLAVFILTVVAMNQGLLWPGEILYDHVLTRPGFKRIMIRSEAGQVDLWISFDSQANAVGSNGLAIRRVPRGGPVHFGGFLGLFAKLQVQEFYSFPVVAGQMKWVRRTLFISVPLWLILLVTAPLSICWIVNARGLRQPGRSGFCAHCGYDLRATPDRCPECGNVVSSTQNST